MRIGYYKINQNHYFFIVIRAIRLTFAIER